MTQEKKIQELIAKARQVLDQLEEQAFEGQLVGLDDSDSSLTIEVSNDISGVGRILFHNAKEQQCSIGSLC